MKYAIFLFGLLFAVPAYAYSVDAGASASATASSPTMCTMEYAPVCGYKIRTDNQCVGEACRVYSTYGNKCMMSADGATYAHAGECTAKELGNNPPSEDPEDPSENPATPPKAYAPPQGCTAWFDGCNSCSRGPDGNAACTLRACFAYQPGYCTKWDETPIPVEPDGGIGISPNDGGANADGEVAVDAQVDAENGDVGFFARIWASFLAWF